MLMFLFIYTGFAFHFLLLIGSTFWLAHIISIFITIMFPTTGKKLKKKSKYIHLATVVGVFLFCLIGPVIAVNLSVYTILSAPPIVCFIYHPYLNFFLLLFLANIVGGVGACLWVVLFWKTYKVGMYLGVYMCIAICICGKHCKVVKISY